MQVENRKLIETGEMMSDATAKMAGRKVLQSPWAPKFNGFHEEDKGVGMAVQRLGRENDKS